jgi:hypothetical protein
MPAMFELRHIGRRWNLACGRHPARPGAEAPNFILGAGASWVDANFVLTVGGYAWRAVIDAAVRCPGFPHPPTPREKPGHSLIP